MEELTGVPNFIYWEITTNNYCNLHCEHCSNMCDIPLNSQNKNIFRRVKWEISLDDLALFCERFKGVGENNFHIFVGGETTAMPIEKIDEMIDCLYVYKRRIALITNGFNFLGLSKKTINKIDMIILGDHGINHKLIAECKNYVRSFYQGKIKMRSPAPHYNLEIARHHPINRGKQCNFMMRNPTLWGSTLYPCCAIPFVMVFNNNTLIRDELVKAGWTIHNKDVLNTLRNWRETLPKYVKGQCLNNCWRPQVNVGQGGTTITLKKNDVIKKAV